MSNKSYRYVCDKKAKTNDKQFIVKYGNVSQSWHACPKQAEETRALNFVVFVF